MGFDSFVETVARLIQNFEAHQAHYLSKGYLEAQARMDFITPFFKALGWDVENEEGRSPHEREVIVERGETEGRPDYNFRLAGQTKFFVESKSPFESLDNTRHILQAKGYAWNTKEVFFVILTDFEEFRFYDASIRPDERKPDEGLLLKLRYTDYLKNAEKLWEFSRERVAAGSLEALLPRGRRTQGIRIPVDQAFLEEMTEWRSELARNIFKNNPELTAKQLNEVVQRLLDRLVFIRIAEDRHIIEKNLLRDAVDEWESRGGKLHLLPNWLTPLFADINENFNGEIFKPHDCEKVAVDSETLVKIIRGLNPPRSPYRFDVIGVELLGSIYERYLGKTIRVTPKRVWVEEKPEVRKAGGVYYTPKYIVDYIVQNTVGKLIEAKTPKQIEKIRILDPACGSGSFLIGAFQSLIDFHVRYLTAHPKEAHVHPLYPDLIPDGNGGYRLSVRLKAKILRNNLFGVDIDPQAVEITMMSLYLKALEGEKSQLPPKQSLLPELKYNIMCGNSLIGPDIYDQGNFFDEEEPDDIKPFDWCSDAAGFGRIMKAGGFDSVIGNPPYVTGELIPDDQVGYLKRTYKSAFGKFDLYMLFLEKAVKLAKRRGAVGLIVPNKFMATKAGSGLREFLRHCPLREILDFADSGVFEGVTNYPCIVLVGPDEKDAFLYRVCRSYPENEERRSRIRRQSLGSGTWSLVSAEVRSLVKKLGAADCEPLANLVARFSAGVQTGADRALQFTEEQRRKERLERKFLRSCLRGRNVKRYDILSDGRYVFWPYDATSDQIVTEQVLSQKGENLYKLISPSKNRLAKRVWFGRGALELSGAWFGLMYREPWRNFRQPHLITPCLSSRANFALNDKAFCFVTGTAGVCGILPKDKSREALLYLLGVLNSSVINFLVKQRSPRFAGGFYKFTGSYLKQLPIPRWNSLSGRRTRVAGNLIVLVERMLELNQRKHSRKLAPSQVARLEREIAATDEERKIIEGDRS
ncbi:MAG: Eco57I restriction-modification methylase domain-containing protein [Acidobacteria bacterium]|nr:Eco57I restriction-modification methylase domain-containing protein [Acidobacteriota bacterium]